MPYRVQLENFEGPLDLLLFLIKKNEVDIYDIPIAEITQQYLAYLEFIELLDLDHASEFILVAATLIRIKAKMLLPKPELEDEEVEDPREELVQRLLEYQRFKEAAWQLRDLEARHRDFFARGAYTFENDDEPEEPETGREVTLFDLMSVFVEVIKRMPKQDVHTVERIPVTVEEQAEFVLSFFEKRDKVLFRDLLLQIKERIVLVVTFVAILDLVKNQRLSVSQAKPFAEIWIRKR
ncbi:MAG: hypothetical protein D6743_04510 [Calditrichaeota bacterium]|nr:MAG: hypothetical protein D6743_04510 [Calditrichota bacterium]